MLKRSRNPDLSGKCKYIGVLIQASVDDEITEEEKLQLDAHLKECKVCQKAFERAKKSKNLLATEIVEEELPPYFEAKFWDRVEEETHPVEAKPKSRFIGEGIFIPKRLIPKLVGAMVVVLGLVFLFHGTRAPAPEIYIVSPQPQHIVSGEDAIISAAFYPEPKEGTVSLVLNGKTLTPLVELRADHIMYTPEEPFEEGYYKVKVQIKDKNGKIQQEKEWLFYVVP